MIVFSNCKINIGLYITGKRGDGYHNLETIFYPVPLFDVIELLDADETGITIVGQPIPGDIQNNIIIKAWHLLKKDFPHLPPVHFYLLKNIPTGAGLGAGSANGAYTLKALNQKFQLGISTEQLISYALQLGSDCPFFIINKPSFATGRGEIFEEINLDLSGYKLIIVNPGIHISTPWAFQQIQPKSATIRLKDAIVQPVNEWGNKISNDFEAAVIKEHPEIGALKRNLYNSGAIFVAMSGSGSTVYGIFKNTEFNMPHIPESYLIKIITL